MVPVSQLPRAERIAVAQLSGIAKRHAAGQGEGDPVAELHEVSDDRRLLGYAAASFAARATALDRRAAGLLRQAGADEQVIAEQAERVRRRISRPLPDMGQNQRRQPARRADQPPGSDSTGRQV